MSKFEWPDLPDRLNQRPRQLNQGDQLAPDPLAANELVSQWCDAFDGWVFDLPKGVKRLKVVRGSSFYSEFSGGVQLYAYVWREVKNGRPGQRLDAYARGTPSELRHNASNFRREE